jgi:hypothetical protein
VADDGIPLAAVQGTLALDLTLVNGPTPGRTGDLAGPPPDPPGLRVVPPQVARPKVSSAGPATERLLRAWSATFAQAVVEAIGGDRPLAQLVRWTTPRVHQDLERRVRILARTSPAPLRRRTIRPLVYSVHVYQPTQTSAEVSVHVRYGPRSRAIAARLEQRDGRWRCTDLQLG